MENYNNVIYSSNINPIGGVETVIYNIARKYQDRDITVMYSHASSEQLYRLSKYCKLVEFKEQKFHCKRLFVNYGYNDIKDYVTCDEGFNVIHANYNYLDAMGDGDYHKNLNKDFKTLAVSNYAGENCGMNYTLCPNPILVEKKDCLLLVSATRLHSDKGNIVWRMQKLADRLTQRGISFLWLIFTTGKEKINNINVVNIPSRLDIHPYLQKADFVIQLSDSEACCMTVGESLALGTPVIVTKVPSFFEKNYCTENNSISLDFDMSNIDECIDKMVNKKFKFEYKPPNDIWGDLLVEKRKEELKPMKMIKVKATDKWQVGGGIVCNVLGRAPEIGEEFLIPESDINKLTGDNPYGLVLVEILGPVEDEKKENEQLQDEKKTPAKSVKKGSKKE